LKTENKLENEEDNGEEEDDGSDRENSSDNKPIPKSPATPSLFGNVSKSNFRSFSSFLNAENKFPSFGSPSTPESKSKSSSLTPFTSPSPSSPSPLFSFTPHPTSSIFKNIPNPETSSPTQLKIPMPEIPVNTGEEGENTVFQVRTKLYVLTQDTPSNQYIYKERGIGVLKLNVSKESRARLVMRTDGAFRLILNVALSTVEYQSLDSKSIRISAMEEEKNTQTLRSFALRVLKPFIYTSSSFNNILGIPSFIGYSLLQPGHFKQPSFIDVFSKKSCKFCRKVSFCIASLIGGNSSGILSCALSCLASVATAFQSNLGSIRVIKTALNSLSSLSTSFTITSSG